MSNEQKLNRANRTEVSVRETPFGRDMLDVLVEKQLRRVRFRELDVAQAILTMKHHLVHKFAPQKGEYPSELRFIYPAYFDSARVLIAEYVAEFFQTGVIVFSELDMERWEYIDHEVRQITLTEWEIDSLLRVLYKAQKPDHDMCARRKLQTERNRWQEHIQDVYQVISQLK